MAGGVAGAGVGVPEEAGAGEVFGVDVAVPDALPAGGVVAALFCGIGAEAVSGAVAGAALFPACCDGAGGTAEGAASADGVFSAVEDATPGCGAAVGVPVG